MDDHEHETAIVTHQPCDDCGSSDALAVYADHTFCHACRKRRNTDGDAPERPAGPRDSTLLDVHYEPLPKRRLTVETCRLWSYGVAQYSGRKAQVATYKTDDRRPVAQKFRLPDKKFPWVGNRKEFKGLYGQWLWKTGGKTVIICEGEIDALSISQVQDHKWPVVSLPDGAGSETKSIKESLDWLNGFEKVILFFDNDEPGRAAADKAKKLFPPGKCYITYAPEGFKDASDLLMAGRGAEIIKCIFSAKQYRPDGIVSGQGVLDRLKSRPETISIPFPDTMPLLNAKTGGGFRLGELDTWTSGTGMGKTTLIKAIQHHIFNNTPFTQALIHLEEPLEDTATDLIGYQMGHRLGIDGHGVPQHEIDATAEHLFMATDADGNPRLQLYDAFGSLEDESLYGVIRYMAVACGCQVFWLDHLSILVSGMGDDGDERKRIDSIMHNLKSLTIELGIYIGLISHLRKPPGSKGPSFETGAVPTLDDLRGSGGIKQLSNGVFAISRNQQETNEVARNTSLITVLKCRKTGRTGSADYVQFEDATGRLIPGQAPEAFDDFPEEPGDY